MQPFKTGQLVRIKNSRKGLITYRCEKRPNYWGITYTDDKTSDCIHSFFIAPYTHRCWNCGTDLDSSQHTTCPICHWLKCPHCYACRKGGCILDSLNPHD
jgi:hypothetical protein